MAVMGMASFFYLVFFHPITHFHLFGMMHGHGVQVMNGTYSTFMVWLYFRGYLVLVLHQLLFIYLCSAALNHRSYDRVFIS